MKRKLPTRPKQRERLPDGPGPEPGDPSPTQIEERAAAIRARWTKGDRAERSVREIRPLEIGEVSAACLMVVGKKAGT